MADTILKSWAEFYSTRTGDDYLEYVASRYKPFIDTIVSVIKPFDIVHEIGCGTGCITKLLHKSVPKSVQLIASDNNLDMIRYAKNRLYFTDCFVHLRSAQTPYNSEVVHSHGLLEHFSDSDIRSIISAHRTAYQVHYVPGLYDSPSFGDERLMSADAWANIVDSIEPMSMCFITPFNDGLGYIIEIDPF